MKEMHIIILSKAEFNELRSMTENGYGGGDYLDLASNKPAARRVFDRLDAVKVLPERVGKAISIILDELD